MSRPAESDETSDDEWRFGIDEVGPDAEPAEPVEAPIEPGSPTAENIAFVLVGVLLTVGLLFVTVFPNSL
ncbi:hypothetical protein ACFQJC_12375 [Haloferax namakaokahaiae]|uniref:DUF7312 domain-containing protein n=1 Tax=Haloferax namakaokahaiae TaxID=1748331 RepID=A0ABD5ZGL6_9EURY